MKWRFLLYSLFAFISLFAQRSKDGAKVIASAGSIVNEYIDLTSSINVGDVSIQVSSSSLNANSRFPAPLAAGDLIFIYQTKGASVNACCVISWGGNGQPRDSTLGQITAYNGTGQYEFAEVKDVPNSTTIELSCPVKNAYTAGFGRTQIIRVPRYLSLTINPPGILTAQAWDGTTGGLLVTEVNSNTVVNPGASIDVSGLGFRGGVRFNVGTESTSTLEGTNDVTQGAEKGESICGFQTDYNIVPWTGAESGGRYGKNSMANGGGGGCSIDAGGGGGANGGNPNPNVWNGRGVPDLSGPSYTMAWSKENPWVPFLTSPGGGRGGYKFANSAQNPLTTGPGNASWGGDHRENEGGLGGRPVDYSTGGIFLGGGGGAGQGDNNYSGSGGNGGGLIYLLCYGSVSGTGQIISNGNAGVTAQGASGSSTLSGKDGAGGGGAGGTVIIQSNVSAVSIYANGGKGGDQIMTKGVFAGGWEVQGPGGGGGGGYIAFQSGLPAVQQVTGGANGTTNSQLMTKFPPNGATGGGDGSMNQTISSFDITVRDTTLCSNASVTLTAQITGTANAGATLTWYDAAVGGNVLTTGSSYTTPVLSSSTTYYVGTCPGYFRVPVNVNIGGSFSCSLTPTAAGCTTGGAVTVTLSGGSPAFTYSWSNGSTNATLTNVPAASYTVKVTDAGGCTSTSTTTVGNGGSTIDLSAVSTTNPLCFGQATGTASVSPAGGTSPYTYTWNNSITTATNSNIASGIYSVTVTDNTGCSGSTTATLTDNPVLSLTTGSSPASCTAADGQAWVTTTGGSGSYAYSWIPGSAVTPTASNISSGSYTISVTDTHGCTQTQAVLVGSSGGFTANVTGITNVSCFGGADGSAAVSASSGTLPYTYSWQPNGATSITVSNLSAGSQTVVVSDANGCFTTLPFSISQPSSALSVAVTTTAATCGSSNGTAVANVSGGTIGYSYSWSPSGGAAATASGLSGGPYALTITDANGCTANTTATVAQTSAANPTVTAVNSSICQGGSTTLNAGGSNTYSWLPSSSLSSSTGSLVTANPTSPTTYTVTGTDVSGCTATATLSLNVYALPVGNVTGTTAICNGANATLTAAGGTAYNWSPGTGLNSTNTATVTADPTINVTYTVTVTDANNCSSTTTTALVVNSIPTIGISGSTVICTGQSTTITASGGVSYSWSNGIFSNTNTITPALSSPYTVTVTDANSCSTSSVVQITVNSFPVASAGNDTSLCAGSSIQLNGSGGINYSWSPVTGLSNPLIGNPVASPSSPTKYILTVSNGSSCNSNDTVMINVISLPIANAGSDQSITLGKSTTLNGSGGGSYSWTPSSSLDNSSISSPKATPDQTTTYTLTVSDANGCSSTSTVTVSLDIICGDLFVPNAFSPNGDGYNDILFVRNNCITELYFAVFDRWGEMVFSTTDKNAGWDGNYRGVQTDTGVFTYYLKATLLNGSRVNRQGNVSLMR